MTDVGTVSLQEKPAPHKSDNEASKPSRSTTHQLGATYPDGTKRFVPIGSTQPASMHALLRWLQETKASINVVFDVSEVSLDNVDVIEVKSVDATTIQTRDISCEIQTIDNPGD